MAKPKYNWSELKPRLKKLASDGHTVTSAAKALGMSYNTLHTALQRRGWLEWFPVFYEKVEYQGVIDSISGHARRVGIKRDTAHKRIRQMRASGFPVDYDVVFSRKHRAPNITPRELERISEAAEIRNETARQLTELSIIKIAEKLEVSRYAVERASRGLERPACVDPTDWDLALSLIAERKRLHELHMKNTAMAVSRELGTYHARVKEMMGPLRDSA